MCKAMQYSNAGFHLRKALLLVEETLNFNKTDCPFLHKLKHCTYLLPVNAGKIPVEKCCSFWHYLLEFLRQQMLFKVCMAGGSYSSALAGRSSYLVP